MATEVIKARIRWSVALGVAVGIALGILLAENVMENRLEERVGTRVGERNKALPVEDVGPGPGPGNPYGDCVNGVGDQVDDSYFNSCEPGCGANFTALNPDFLLCDDFEDGVWAETLNIFNAANDGWGLPNLYCNMWDHGTTSPPPYYGGDQPCGYPNTQCGGGGAAGTDCAADNFGITKDERAGQQNEGWGQDGRHLFYPGHGALTDELYMRYYLRVPDDPGYAIGYQKMMFFEGQGSQFCRLHWVHQNPQPIGPHVSCYSDDQQPWMTQNISLVGTIQLGHWYYIEVRLKMDTSIGADNGVFEMWMDDCGVSGDGCTGPGTLRSQWTSVSMRQPSNPDRIFGQIWLESWGNPRSSPEGAAERYDQIIISKSRIGPMTPIN